MAEAHVTTRPNRYLLIATSGGLNQQRTGVFLWSTVIIINTAIVKHEFHIWIYFLL